MHRTHPRRGPVILRAREGRGVILSLLFVALALVALADLAGLLGELTPLAYGLTLLGAGQSGSRSVVWTTTAVSAALLTLGLFVPALPDDRALLAHLFSLLALCLIAWMVLGTWRRAGELAHADIAAESERAVASAVAAREKALEEQARRSRAVLSVMEDLQLERRRLAEEVRAREELTSRLSESNKELQQFAYVASHDLQTPLRSISGFAQILVEDYGSKLSEEAHGHIERILKGTARMQELINDLLSYSRVGAANDPFESVSLDRVFDDVLESMSLTVEETQARITREHLPTVLGDRSQLSQLFQNLVGNAIKYAGDSPPELLATAEKTDGEWTLSFRDNGIGIDPRYHERIFEIFRRLHAVEEIPGTGIGLAVCRRVVSRHGGRMWVDSSVGQGSTFRFTLPAEEE